MTFDELVKRLRGVTEETTIEEARRVIAEVVESFETQITDNNGLIETLRTDVTTRDETIHNLEKEIDRLKEENGRLYRERLFTETTIMDTIDTTDDVQEAIEKLENEIEY